MLSMKATVLAGFIEPLEEPGAAYGIGGGRVRGAALLVAAGDCAGRLRRLPVLGAS